ncbi:L,D-transpeptidase [Seohaeicola zhoushanensis]|uniref:L,D-TPase catalytic domain-containing protein n=1 Tax=Seohaeicola zhoushanensis TaxID=1569283 RepID=A0A8J3GWE1_9RHOB|nr:L,D-transpeptidase [Seohaeicola zhoushanensis]GHF43612.1 hypothetical protein GCM10017056_14390 [Seohaeicola zhoushanensis]
MIQRRCFLTGCAATLALPSLARAAQEPFDIQPQYVWTRREFDMALEPGQILIVPSRFYLYLVTDKRKAIRYGVAVGKEGLEFRGTAVVQVKKEWPTWRPTPEMIKRDPRTYRKFVDNDYVQPGGPGNPLGARALYLFQDGRDTGVRIHGTIAPETIGTAGSNGCFRMINEHVMDLYTRVPVGTPVTVL